MRHRDICRDCGQEKEIVADGRCHKCDMRKRRAEQNATEPGWLVGPDRSQNRAQRELNRARVAFAKMLALLDEAPTASTIMSPDDYQKVKSILIAASNRINAKQGGSAQRQFTVNPELESTRGRADGPNLSKTIDGAANTPQKGRDALEKN
jgi:hypothetical protein